MSDADLRRRVEAAAAEALARQKFVTPVDVCVGLGWLHESNLDDWRRGHVDDLDYFLPVHDNRLIDLIIYLHEWAQARGLTRTGTDYVSATRDRRPLRFFTDGDPLEEVAWRSQWTSADVPAEGREKVVKRQAAPPDLVVVQPIKDWTCAECGGTDDLLISGDKGPLCLSCADMDHLVFLPSGDAALTRRAKKASTLSAVVVRWSKTRKRYERQGLLVEELALEQAEEQCLADSDVRMRRRERDAERRVGEDLDLQARFAAEVTRLFPGCPAERAEAIARHTVLRGSGRVGRSAAGRAIDEKAVTLAVVASVRHENTEYDSLLMTGVAREEARDLIRPDIDRILSAWA